MKRAGVIFLAMLLSFIPVASLGIQMVKAETSTGGWIKTYGGTSDDSAFALVRTSDGGYALAGSTESFGADLTDFWLVKTDASCTMQWNRTYRGTGSDVATALVETRDGGYALAGITRSLDAVNADCWLVRTDSAGNAQWNRTYGGTSFDGAHALVQTSDGGYALAGFTYSFGAGDRDFWLVKTDPAGTMQWNKTYGGRNVDYAFALVQTDDEGYTLVGITESFGAGGYDAWLVKTDASGNMQWNQTYGGTNDDWAYALVQSSDGGYALAGRTESFGAGYPGDCWLVKTDPSGNAQWNQTYGGTSWDEVYALVQASDGGYALAGKTSSFGDGNSDVLLAKTGESGNVQWTRTYGGTGVDEAFALVQTADGGYALAGRTWSFGAGLADFWLAKTNASGVIPEPPSPMILAAILVALLVVASSAVILAKRNSKKAPLARIVDSARENRILSSQARAR